jgi:hypothetical protein
MDMTIDISGENIFSENGYAKAVLNTARSYVGNSSYVWASAIRKSDKRILGLLVTTRHIGGGMIDISLTGVDDRTGIEETIRDYAALSSIMGRDEEIEKMMVNTIIRLTGRIYKAIDARRPPKSDCMFNKGV